MTKKTRVLKMSANEVLSFILNKLDRRELTPLEIDLGSAIASGQTDKNTAFNQLTVAGYRSKYEWTDSELKGIAKEVMEYAAK